MLNLTNIAHEALLLWFQFWLCCFHLIQLTNLHCGFSGTAKKWKKAYKVVASPESC